MLDYIIKRAKENYEDLKTIIEECKVKQDIINKLRIKNVIIEEYQNKINIIKDELKIVIDIQNNIEIKEILVFNENYEDYVNLF